MLVGIICASPCFLFFFLHFASLERGEFQVGFVCLRSLTRLFGSRPPRGVLVGSLESRPLLLKLDLLKRLKIEYGHVRISLSALVLDHFKRALADHPGPALYFCLKKMQI